jgi:multiple sugar transport system substrate-binding protein
MDAEANALTNGFFQSTLPTVEKAFLRPRFAGFPQFQNAAFDSVWKFLKGEGSPEVTLNTLDELYRKCSR